MSEVLGSWNLPTTTTLCWRTHLAHTKQDFHAMIGGKFAALTTLGADGIDVGNVDWHLQHSSVDTYQWNHWQTSPSQEALCHSWLTWSVRQTEGTSAGADSVPAELVQAGEKPWQVPYLLSATRSGRQGSGPHHGPNLLSSPSQRKATYSYARTIVPSVSSATGAKLCWHSCWIDWSRKRKRSSLKNKQASDQSAAQHSRSSTLGYCARSTSNTSKTSTTSSWTSRRRSIRYGMQHYGPPWDSTTSTPTWSEWYRTSITRPPAQSTLITA